MADIYLARKTADETVNNSNTLQNDNHLFFSIGASERWFVEALLLCQGASNAADWQFGWSGPSGATASWGVSGVTSTPAVFGAVATTSTPGAVGSIASTVSVGGRSGTIAVMLAGWFVASTTAGTIQLRWAQNTPTSEDNILLTDSLLRCTRYAWSSSTRWPVSTDQHWT